MEYRKYLIIVGVLGIIGLAGSYWYLNYFLDEIGIDSEKVLKSTRNLGQKGIRAIAEIPGTPVQSMPSANVQTPTLAQPANFWGTPAAPVAPTDQESFSVVVQSIMPSVVSVNTENRGISRTLAPADPSPTPATAPQQPQQDGGLRFMTPFSGVAMESIGSGLIVSADGYIISNYHVVENSRNIYVTVFGPMGNRRFPAEVVRLDPSRDLVLLKVSVPVPLQPAPLGNSDLVRVGDPVITVGCPFGLDQTVSKGIISGARKAVTIEGVVHKDLIQTDAAINQGNSGGPLVSSRGYVVGINTAIYSPTQAFSGVGFSVPVNSVREFINEQIAIPEVTPAMAVSRMGQGQQVAAKAIPAIPLNAVAPHGDRGPCENCHAILGSGQVARQPAFQGGATGINVALPQAAPSTEQTPVNATPAGFESVIGARFQPLDDMLRQRFAPLAPNGVFVQSVQTDSPAAAGGLVAGDIIFKLDGRWVNTPDDLKTRLQSYAVGDKARLSISRKRTRMDLAVVISVPPVTALQPAAPVAAPQTPVAARQVKPAVPTEFEWLGMELLPIDEKMIKKNAALKEKKGAVVQEIDPGLEADLAGMRSNDIVLSINGQAVATNAALDKAIQASTTASAILLDVARDNKRMFVKLR
ncbi:MAG: trypsin-like peptidase domain-containing protein [Magnetococcales bacterium]|nr:trypsin-like peptidase domain-containing protein [Magnetococcales bacterium]